jgi:hypothetical protein
MYLTSVYAAILGLVLLQLGIRTLHLRRRLGIPIGDGGSSAMLRAMRVQANFVEYVPMTLLLILLIELQGGSLFLVNLLCLLLLTGRIVHAIGVSRVAEDYRFRVLGMAMTFASLALSASYLVVTALASRLSPLS